MVRVRDSPTCAICEYVMKQLESMLEDHTTEVRCARLDMLINDFKNKLQPAANIMLVQLALVSS